MYADALCIPHANVHDLQPKNCQSTELNSKATHVCHEDYQQRQVLGEW